MCSETVKHARKKVNNAGPVAPRSVYLGDKIKVERRYVVDGVLTCISDKGVFNGIQVLGSSEHIVIESKEGVRMIPLATVSEIFLEQAARKGAAKAEFDPSFC